MTRLKVRKAFADEPDFPAGLDRMPALDEGHRVRDMVVADSGIDRIGNRAHVGHLWDRPEDRAPTRLNAGESYIERLHLSLRHLIERVVIVSEPEVIDGVHAEVMSIGNGQVLGA